MILFLVAALSFTWQCADLFNPDDSSSSESLLALALLGTSAANDGGGGQGAGGAGACTPALMGGAMMGCELAFQNGMNVTTPYGPAQGNTTNGDADGTGNAAAFNNPRGMTTDGTNIYVADTVNNRIRRIVIATGVVTTLAGPAAGTTASGDTDGTGNAARFNFPTGITTDGTNLFVTDRTNNKIRQIVIATGVVTTLAGPAAGTTTFGDTDGTGNAARFSAPREITTDGTNLYVADEGNNKIRRIVIATGVVTTLAGPAPGSTTSGDADGTGNAARFSSPAGITTDGTNLYVSDTGNNKIRRIVIATGVVTTLAGPAAGTTTSGDDDGTGNAARFQAPVGITMDGTNLYVADSINQKIRKIVIASAAVTTPAGPAPGGFSTGDTDAVGNDARFTSPFGIITDGTKLYVGDSGNNKIRAID